MSDFEADYFLAVALVGARRRLWGRREAMFRNARLLALVKEADHGLTETGRARIS